MEWHQFKVPKGQTQLAAFLRESTGDSLSIVKRALQNGGCLINGRIERFGSTLLGGGETIEYRRSQTVPLNFEKARVLFENDDILIYNKPVGLVCDPKALEKIFPGLFLTHRLDKDTSGVLVFAKTQKALGHMEMLFRKRLVKKEYIALVDGHFDQKKGKIQNNLAKVGNFQGQTLWGVAEAGAEAVTEWEVLEQHDTYAKVLLKPLTGRTHQLRVHMKFIDHPILGDRQYSKEFTSEVRVPHVMLHSKSISFEDVSVEAPLPKEFDR